ncbi:MAG TPA: lipoate--protein ligase family protein [Gemmataceae bacterium]|nr:lipoate--protein ligase family protein [Gemmataceae bacterium]
MHFLDLTLSSLAENLALDEALLLAAESGNGGEVLRFWEWPGPAIVLGAGGRIADDVDEAACLADGVSLSRRSSGGGTILLGRGCLLYTLILSYERAPALREISPSYRFILGQIGQTLTDGDGRLEQAGISDLVCAGRKVSGTAQQRKRSFLLHHGTLLYDMDLSLVPRYLREPPRQPDYRVGRPHLAFVGNLPLSGDTIKQQLRRIWDANAPLITWPTDAVRQLVTEKYTQDDWIRRR